MLKLNTKLSVHFYAKHRVRTIFCGEKLINKNKKSLSAYTERAVIAKKFNFTLEIISECN